MLVFMLVEEIKGCSGVGPPLKLLLDYFKINLEKKAKQKLGKGP